MKKLKWFKPVGWFYAPISWQGWLVYLLGFAFMINTFIVIDRHSHSVSDTMYGIFPFWVPTFLVLMWIASNTSQD